MGLGSKVLSFTCMSALALSVGCKTVNRHVEEDIPSKSEYLYEEYEDTHDGVEYLVYADPDQKKCRVDFMYLTGMDMGAEPRKSMLSYLKSCCELDLGYK
ncbi:MAG: hypothetical protein ABIJ18_02445 [archaeon]